MEDPGHQRTVRWAERNTERMRKKDRNTRVGVEGRDLRVQNQHCIFAN